MPTNFDAAFSSVRGAFDMEKAIPPASEEELIDLLSERIEQMLAENPDYLMSLLYRLDVLEPKIVAVMHPAAPEPAPRGLARLVLERQKQRIETKRTIRPDALEGMDDWKW